MKQAVHWVLLRTALYAGVAVAGVTGTGFLYSAATGNDVLAGSPSSAANFAGWLNVGASVAVLGSCLTLILLAVFAPFRARLTGMQIKLMLLPFFLLPVPFADLAGTTPSFTLLLGRPGPVSVASEYGGADPEPARLAGRIDRYRATEIDIGAARPERVRHAVCR